ncbi:MAG: SDR family oxidoreductase [Ectothiorhodospiraceae bacterium]|nr:SDR family oxidoreductase [Ectothiorhodospiraceae bacterium]
MTLFLNQKIILVTGGSSGVGRATAIALARHGATVVIADIDRAGGASTVASIRSAGGIAEFVATDMRDASAVASLIAGIAASHGRLDGAFNNAGILEGTFTAFTELDEDVWNRVIDINLKGVWLCMKHEIPLMLRQGSGTIVNHASIAGLYGNRIVGPAYIASKHGVVGITRAAALEYADRGLRINAVCPGIIDETVMSEAIFGSDRAREAQVKALYPAGRVGSLEEVAETVAWLFSDATSFITGHALPIDGGLLAQ